MVRPPAIVLVAFAVGATLAPAAYAQDARAGVEDANRYEFTEMSRWGFMRLDRQTGQVSHCRHRSRGRWVCEPVADDRAAYETEIARQTAKVAELEAELARQASKIAALETELARRSATPGPAPTPAPQTAPRPEVKLQLPSDEEVERALRYLESVFRRFIGSRAPSAISTP